jgi:hypothetical protein
MIHTGKVLGMDAFGWGVVGFLTVLIGVPYARFFLRRAKIPTWPVASATVETVEITKKLPNLAAGYSWKLNTWFCRAGYVFPAGGANHASWFAIPAKNQQEAKEFTEALKGQPVLVRYNPLKPNDCTLEDQRVLGRKIIQDTSILNPKLR